MYRTRSSWNPGSWNFYCKFQFPFSFPIPNSLPCALVSRSLIFDPTRTHPFLSLSVFSFFLFSQAKFHAAIFTHSIFHLFIFYIIIIKKKKFVAQLLVNLCVLCEWVSEFCESVIWSLTELAENYELSQLSELKTFLGAESISPLDSTTVNLSQVSTIFYQSKFLQFFLFTLYFSLHFIFISIFFKINKNKNFRILCLWLFGEKSRFMINWHNLERIFNFQLYWLTQWVLTDSGKVWDLGTTITPWIPHSHSREEED